MAIARKAEFSDKGLVRSGLHGTERWRRMAKHQLRIEPMCAMCLAEGRGPVPARVADHITPHHNDVNQFWLGKLQSLCTHCHESRKKSVENIEKRGYDKTVDVTGWPIDPRHPVYRR
jgi:hypothetical protein